MKNKLIFLTILCVFSLFISVKSYSLNDLKDTVVFISEDTSEVIRNEKNISPSQDTSKVIPEERKINQEINEEIIEENKEVIQGKNEEVIQNENEIILDENIEIPQEDSAKVSENEQEKTKKPDFIPLRDSMFYAAEKIIKRVNEYAIPVDSIHAEAEISIKTSKVDEEGNIEVKAKKPDDFWFRIWGSFAFISKDAFFGHFNRNKFIYFNNLNNYSIEGPTTDNNIGYIVRVRTSFDDMMNALTGTVYIPVYDEDTVTMKTDAANYIVMMKSPKYVRQYWIKKSDYSVSKYEYYNNKMQASLRLEFYNFVSSGIGRYARNITVYRPVNRDEMKVHFTSYLVNQSYLDFKVEIPYDARRKVWK